MLPEKVVFTDRLKELFRKCFVAGKENRMERPSAKDFEFALLDACNKVIKCPSCGYWHYARKNKPCPWCNAASKLTAWLTFYDKMINDNLDINASFEEEKMEKKGITTYFLKEGKNIIHSSYVLRAVNSSESGWGNRNENYLTVVKDDSGYHLYNEYNKDAVYVKKHQTGEMLNIGHRKAELLASGDEIYFDTPDNKKSIVRNNNKEYKLIRTAVFVEEN
jgi:hypothetical protein